MWKCVLVIIVITIPGCIQPIVEEENMVLAIEPRLAVDNIYLFGNEDMVHVTKDGGVSFSSFPKEPLEI